MRLLIAIKAFFYALASKKGAVQIQQAMTSASDSIAIEISKSDKTLKETAKPKNDLGMGGPKSRSDALTLLTALQRESRLLDLVHDTLDDYTDAQIGSAARNVLRDAGKALDRIFGLNRLVEMHEGDQVEVPEAASPVRWKVLGSTANRKGVLVHAGWIASKSELPQWSGTRDDSMVIAPAEVETNG